MPVLMQDHGDLGKGKALAERIDITVEPESDELASDALARSGWRKGSAWKLNVQFSNLCPLKCRMCAPRFSSKRVEEWKALQNSLGREAYRAEIARERSLTERQWYDLLCVGEPFGDLVELELEGGEPFADGRTARFIEALPRPANVDFRMTTNALSPSAATLDLVSRFKSASIFASAEATGELYRYVRGREFSEFEAGFAAWRSVANVQIEIVCMVSAFTLFGAADIFRWARDRGAKIKLFPAQTPEFVSPSVFPIELRLQALERFENLGLDEAAAPELFEALSVDRRSDDESRISAYQSFIEYATDLDRLRGDRLALAAPELLQLAQGARGGTRKGSIKWPSRRE